MGKYAEIITLLSSSTKTASSETDHKDLGSFNEGVACINLTALSGTEPTLDLTLQFSPDLENWFDDPDTVFYQMYGTGKQVVRFSNFGKYVRLKYVLGGTDPSFTFSIDLLMKD
ncbi:MAG TPA: hypothetical protein VMV56_07625 [Williamwhitmania sp.]|nr:hypothetical protein [Williamwhitmania sp.]